MTREEALEELHRLTFNLDFEEDTSEDEADRVVEVLNMAIQALEERKTGKWIPVKGYEGILWECSECHDKMHHTTIKWSYCPDCGAKMVKPQESETWNSPRGQITAPKGTFERIFNDADDDNDI